MAQPTLGLSSHDEEHVLEYLKFARFRRSQCVRTVEAAFQDTMDSRLTEPTFTSDEVRELLSGLSGAVKADVESELISTSHTNVLLLRQLFTQAEKWHLKLQVNVSEMENRELLEMIAQFEQREFSSSSSSQQPSTPSHRHTLEPLNTSGGEKLLNMEIDRLKEENRILKERVQTLETKASSALMEKDKLRADLASNKAAASEVSPTPPESNSGELSALQEKISQLQLRLSESQSSGSSAAVQEELAHTAHELLRVTAELEKTKEELDKRFEATTQFVNMKKMMASKNEQIKKLRTALNRYESEDKPLPS